MSLSRLCSIVVLLILFATAASADIIFPSSRPRPRHSQINLKVDRVPPGMVLLYLDQFQHLIGRGGEKEGIVISKPGTLYLARKSDLTDHFSYRASEKKLFQLKTVDQDMIPSSYGVLPLPLQMRCSVVEVKPNDYRLDCGSDRASK